MQATWVGMDVKPLEILRTLEPDPAWLKCLPEGTQIISTKGAGASYWSRTARIDAVLPDGQEKRYFLKLAHSDNGLLMCRGEYESMVALYAVSPDFVPRPVGYGTFEANPDQHFFICDYLDFDDELPHVVEFGAGLADLHERSKDMAAQLRNPHNMFGFHVIVCNGTVPQNHSWCESWEQYFTENMIHCFDLEERFQGPSERIKQLLPDLYEKVIPRLLRPLETDGRTLPACLLHGDLWNGNTAVHSRTDKPYMFDAASIWGHNECDLAKFRGSRYRMRRIYVKEYTKHYPISPPEEDFDDRNLLYSLRADLHDSVLFPSTTRFRELVIATLEKLVHKFPKGYEGTEPRKGSQNLAQKLADQPVESTDSELVAQPAEQIAENTLGQQIDAILSDDNEVSLVIADNKLGTVQTQTVELSIQPSAN